MIVIISSTYLVNYILKRKPYKTRNSILDQRQSNTACAEKVIKDYLDILQTSLWFMALRTEESPTSLRIQSSIPILV